MNSFDHEKAVARMEQLDSDLAKSLPRFQALYQDEYRMRDGSILTTTLLGRLVNFIGGLEDPQEIVRAMDTVSDALEALASEHDRTIDIILETGFFEDLWIMGDRREDFVRRLKPNMLSILRKIQQDAAASNKISRDPLS